MAGTFRFERSGEETAPWTDFLLEFENAWSSSERPALRPILERATPAERSGLLRELLLRDWRLRIAAGEAPSADEYIAQLPDFAEEIRRLTVETSTVNSPPASDTASTVLGFVDRSTPASEGARPGAALPQRIGEFEVLAQIGKGGMGVVYKARHPKLPRLVAIKLLRTGALASAEEVARFEGEAQAAARLEHPGIVPVFEVGESDGQHFLVLAYVEGESLAHRVHAGPLAPSEAARIVESAARAIQFAHEHGVIHRDLKPANILMTADDQPKVTDFGLAKLVNQDAGLTHTGQILGTPAYMPPEQATESAVEVGPRSDVYSLGATLYCLLTGRPPFQAATKLETLLQVARKEPVTPRALNPAIPVDLETICLKCLQKDPEKRYATAMALADDLLRFRTGHPIVARPVTAAERAWRWCRREPMKAGLAVAAVASLVVGAVASSVFAWRASDRASFAETALGREQTALGQARKDATAARKAEGVAETQSGLAKQAAATALTAEEEARKRADHNAQLLYDADMQYVQQAWERGELPEIRTCLARHDPKNGEPDRRDFEWHYWRKLTDRPEPIRFVTPAIRGWEKPGLALLLDDERTLVGVQRDGQLSVWTIARRLGIDEATLQKTIEAHTDRIVELRLSPNGKILATATRAGSVKLWNAADQSPLQELSHPQGFYIETLLFDRSSTRLAVVNDPSSADRARVVLYVWDLAFGRKIDEIQDADLSGFSGPSAVEFAPLDNRLLFSHSRGAALWDLGERRILQRFDRPAPDLSSVWTYRLAEGGKLAVGLGSRDELFVWDVETGARLSTLIAPGTSNSDTQELRVSPDGTKVAVGQDDRLTRIWDLRQNLLLRTHRGLQLPENDAGGRPARLGAIHKDRDAFWAGERTNPEVKEFELKSGVLALDPTGATVVVEGFTTHASLLHGESYASRVVLLERGRADEYNVNRVKYDPSGRHFAIALDDGRVDVFDVAGRSRLPIAIRHDDVCHDVAFVPDSNLLAACDEDGIIRLWDLTNGNEIARLAGHTTLAQRRVDDLRRSHPERRIPNAPSLPPRANAVKATTPFFAGADRYTVTVTSRPYSELSGAVLGLAAHPSGERLASIGGDGTIRVWDLKRREEIWHASCESGSRFQCVVYDPKGDHLAAGGEGTILIWDARTHELTGQLTGHSGAVRELKFNPQGTRLASAGIDSTIRLWDVSTGQQTLRFDLPRRPVSSYVVPYVVPELQFDPIGRALMTAEGRNRVAGSFHISSVLRLWDARDPNWIDPARDALPGPSQGSPPVTVRPDASKLPAILTNQAGMKMRRVPKGRFNLNPSYDVLITRPFYLGETEVTVAQFRRFVEATGYVTDAERYGGDLRIPPGTQQNGRDLNWKSPGFAQADDHPAAQVSWNDARAFCEWLTKTEGVTHRLPTEAEWEWACRAGSDAKFCFGNDDSQLAQYGWFLKNTENGSGTRPVGQLTPNAWGLHDMYGNVCEWVSDYFGANPRGTHVDPQGPESHSEKMHTARGGAFDSDAKGCSPRSYGWVWFGGESFAVHHFGFRVLCEVPN